MTMARNTDSHCPSNMSHCLLVIGQRNQNIAVFISYIGWDHKKSGDSKVCVVGSVPMFPADLLSFGVDGR